MLTSALPSRACPQIYTKMAYFQESSTFVQGCYITGIVVCMCLSLRNVLGTTMLTMLAPGKALRGPDGSMHTAVDGMLDAFEGIAIVQHLTIYSFMATLCALAWGAESRSVASSTLMTTLVLGITYKMYITCNADRHNVGQRGALNGNWKV